MSEIEELRAEVERLRDAKQRLSERAARDVLAAEAALVSEREAHAGLRARLEALADEWEQNAYRCTKAGDCPVCVTYQGVVIGLRRALAAETAEATASRPPETSGAGSIAPVAAEEGGEQEEGEADEDKVCKTFLPQDPNVPHVERERCHVDRPHREYEHTKGLFPKYRVERIYDPTGKHADCRYFVLDPQHDPLARPALAVYAAAAKDAYLDTLSADLRGWLLHITPSGSDEQGNRPATPDANGVHDTKGGEGRG